jgi:hypothetical protein
MPDTSPRLSLPFIAPAQAQKHVTHNEAIARLDLLAQLHVLGFDATTPPADPAPGDAWALGAGATGAWAGHDGQLALYGEGGWEFVIPRAGWQAADVTQNMLRLFTGSDWVPVAVDTQNLPGLGVNASHDSTNRLSVSSAASLLTHEGAGHQLKINKAGPSDTGSVLFQTGYSGRAELGLAGQDDFTLKVSSDGGTWQPALRADPATGHVTVPRLSSGLITVDEDSVGLIDTPGSGGFVLLTMVDDRYPQSQHSGILVYDTGDSLTLAGLTLGSHLENLDTATLTGTTCTPGRSAVAVAPGQLQIENRFSGTRRYSYTFIGGGDGS